MGHQELFDRSRAEQALRTHGTPLYRLCLMMLGQKMDAEDAVSETMLRYLTKAPAFRDGDQERAWLFTVAANVCRDMLRKRRKTVPLEDMELADCGTSPAHQAVLAALERLPEKYRTVLCLHYVEGYRTEEIAAMLGLRPGTVRKRLQYGRQKLKLEYEQEERL